MAYIHRRFTPSCLDSIEDIEQYQLGGLQVHPISVGDSFARGRYRILHKLGYGGSSTVWLARDNSQEQRSGRGLVTLKALRADASTKPASVMSDLTIPEILRTADPPCINGIRAAVDHFFVEGPNGSHLFLVFPFAGPSVLCMSDFPGLMGRCRRLRADLARKVALQVTVMVECIHRAGIVYGDLTPSNILFMLSPHVLQWSDSELYANLSVPRTEKLYTLNGDPLPPCAPENIVEPIDNIRLTNPSFLEESVILSDFGQSYVAASPPDDYEACAAMSYCPLELRFEDRVSFEADVWSLGCTIFEIRAGFTLFSSFFGSDLDVLKQTVEMLGRLPDPWWTIFEERELWFEEDGPPKKTGEQDQDQQTVDVTGRSIRGQLRLIGRHDKAPPSEEGFTIEKTGIRLCEEEMELLGYLLEKILKHRPEERITMHEVLQHPWFAFSD